jgi:molecular chaperone DnaK (HSP70)
MQLTLQLMRRTICLVGVTVLLLACSRQKPATNFIVLEGNSPAVGNNGTLVQNIGIETIGGVVTPLLKTGCAIPCRDAEIFSTAQDNQRKFQVTLYRGNDRLVSNNSLVARCYVVDIPPAPRGTPKIEVTFEVAEKEIRIQALDKTSNKPFAIQCDSKPSA